MFSLFWENIKIRQLIFFLLRMRILTQVLFEISVISSSRMIIVVLSRSVCRSCVCEPRFHGYILHSICTTDDLRRIRGFGFIESDRRLLAADQKTSAVEKAALVQYFKAL